MPGSGSGPFPKVTVALSRLSKAPPGGKLSLKVVDGEGLTTAMGLADLLSGPFVQAWQFAAATVPWKDTQSFPKVDAEKLAAIEASAAKAKPARSPTPFVDFLSLSGSRRQSHAAAYAFREIRSDRPRKVKLHTGSDDALRVWLNGKLVQSVLALRSAQADAESAEVELAKGRNRLVVEVCQGIGGWGLYLRIADADGRMLELTDSGELAPVEPIILPAK
jgi:hypothetical protein